MHIDAQPKPATMRKPRRGASGRLRDALLKLAGDNARIVRHEEKSWASITFAGMKHRLTLVFEGQDAVDAGEYFIALLPDHEFTIPGQLVAEATINGVEQRMEPPLLEVRAEVLMLDED